MAKLLSDHLRIEIDYDEIFIIKERHKISLSWSEGEALLRALLDLDSMFQKMQNKSHGNS